MSQLSSASRTLVAALLLLLAAAAAEAAATAEAPAGAACQNDIKVLYSTCYQYVQQGGPAKQPSPDCCATVKGVVNVPCVCDYLGSNSDRDKISMEKVFYVIKQCGVTIPGGSCGE